MRVNTRAKNDSRTHEGAPAVPINAEKALRRSVLSCLLWEREFYEDGQQIADRIKTLAAQVRPPMLAALAIEARHQHYLRHVPLLLLDVLTRTGAGSPLVSETVARVISRADELGEMLAIYTGGGDRKKATPGAGRTISAGLRKGLQRAFAKFDEYQLGKYRGDTKFSLRDVVRIIRPAPANADQCALWGRVRAGTLAVPDTWEVSLTRSADKKETFERLLRESKLGYLALLRNLRNMQQAGVDEGLITKAIIARRGADYVLPFRYVAAARAVPQFERFLDTALEAAIADMPALPGKTLVLVDVSGSMDWKISAKSDLKRIDAAATLASIIPGDIRVFTFSHETVEVPPRRGMAGVDAVINSQYHGGTYLGAAVHKTNGIKADRLIVITDEQSHDPVPDPVAKHAHMINVASAQNGVGYGRWIHIDGFSENVLRFIREVENAD